ncbi:hypothetical protein B0H67DRAFT_641966 [Lasiosphaeris hirsuta]|uniref:GST C-terminal domain-containing protein n=1 Tax=Lasiosphaeris hirsuta TaxID=260670 RepID=A0AA40B0X3_9PEZI|nr:hypothetical protein B0H67DRAFT_641966 [Lasiosphaeris hirsuta]
MAFFGTIYSYPGNFRVQRILIVAASGPKAKIDEWSCYADHELTANALPASLMTTFKVWPFDVALYPDFATNFERALGKLEVGLRARSGKFLVEEELTMADVMVAGPLVLAGSILLNEEMRKVAPSVAGYLEELMEIPVVSEAFGELQLCQTRATE